MYCVDTAKHVVTHYIAHRCIIAVLIFPHDANAYSAGYFVARCLSAYLLVCHAIHIEAEVESGPTNIITCFKRTSVQLQHCHIGTTEIIITAVKGNKIR